MSSPNLPHPRLYVSSSSADDSALLRRVRERLELRLGDQVRFTPAAATEPEDLTAVAQCVQECDAMLVLIGPGWSVPADVGRPAATSPAKALATSTATSTPTSPAKPPRADPATADRERIKTEVAEAVAAGRPVLPVLLGAGTPAPRRTELAPAVEPLAGRLFGRIHEDRADHDLDKVLTALTVRLPGLSLAPSQPPAAPTPLHQSAATNGGGVAVNAGDSINSSKFVGRDDYSDNSVTSKKLVKFGGVGAALVAVVVVLLVLHNRSDQPSSTSDSSSSTTLITPADGPTSAFTPSSAGQSLADAPGSVVSQSPTTDPVTTSSTPIPTSTSTTIGSPPPAAFTTGFHGITGNSLCREFLVAPQDVQYQAAERVAIAMNFGEAAGDPFIVQSTEYACGQNLNVKLATLLWYAKKSSIGP
ncbi:MAG: hypothetical protein ACJ786_41790 [Catenulispora sp.]